LAATADVLQVDPPEKFESAFHVRPFGSVNDGPPALMRIVDCAPEVLEESAIEAVRVTPARVAVIVQIPEAVDPALAVNVADDEPAATVVYAGTDTDELSSESSTDEPPEGAAPDSETEQFVLPLLLREDAAQLSDDNAALGVALEFTEIVPPAAETETAPPVVDAARAPLTETPVVVALPDIVNCAVAITPSGMVLAPPLATQV
jgi:hypothetical protein